MHCHGLIVIPQSNSRIRILKEVNCNLYVIANKNKFSHFLSTIYEIILQNTENKCQLFDSNLNWKHKKLKGEGSNNF